MSKNIFFCADGTWNGPDQDENHDALPDPTNVYKLFLQLAGDLDCLSLLKAHEQEKERVDGQGRPVQVAKYLHGVGDSDNLLARVAGGVFGTGVIARIVRGYTFISRHYQPGDRIYLVGFSRGAYTARALAGLIATQGLLRHGPDMPAHTAYAKGVLAWQQHHAHRPASVLAWLANLFNGLGSLLSGQALEEGDLRPVEHIAAVGVWDTVGAMGLPAYTASGDRADTFGFADLRLSPKVGRGLHAVALDEQRQDFDPTLWEPAPNVVQVLFPGAHADVGGGYPVSQHESGLSDIALVWMMEQLAACGALFRQSGGTPTSPRATWPLAPNPAGVAHQPWNQAPWNLLGTPPRPRRLPGHLHLHRSVQDRRIVSPVRPDPEAEPEVYAPHILPPVR